MILKICGLGWWNPGTFSFLLHSLSLTSSHLILFPPSHSILLPNLLLTPPEVSQMTNQIIHEEISMLFYLEKFSGCWWRHAIMESSSKYRSLIRDLRQILNLDPSLTTFFGFELFAPMMTSRVFQEGRGESFHRSYIVSDKLLYSFQLIIH